MHDELIKELKDIILEISVKKQPEAKLCECMKCYTRPNLAKLGQYYGFSNTRIKKDEFIEKLSEIMIKSMKKNLEFEDIDDLKVLSEIHLMDVDFDNIPMIKIILTYRHKGIIYVSIPKGSEKMCVIVPDEIREIILSFMEDESMVEKSMKNKEKFTYLSALSNLYGVYDKNQFLNVWNNYHDEKMNKEELDSYLEVIQSRKEAAIIDKDWISDMGHFEMAGEEKLKKYIEKVKDKKYYMPSTKEIDIYSEEITDVTSPSYEALKSYLRDMVKNDTDLDNMMFDIEGVCVIDGMPSVVMDILYDRGITFNKNSDAKAFMEVFGAWYNNARLWENRGYTLMELKDDNVDVQLLGQVQKPVESTKIGRNDPCPCGSGKKYKKCCGK